MKKSLLTLAIGLFFINISPLPIYAQGCVDLGLSVNWATCNVGAYTPEEQGTIFIGGQIKEYSNDMPIREIRKMVMIHTQDYSGNPNYDAATAFMGSQWRTPTARDWDELLSKCVWRWCKYYDTNGMLVRGYEITGPNGNSIFLPVRRKDNGKSMSFESYQCSTPVANTKKMNFLIMSSGGRRLVRFKYEDHIFRGLPVRAVTDKK